MRRLILIVFVLSCGGIPSKDEVKADCSATNACIEAAIRFCECCGDPAGGESCDDPAAVCRAAKRADNGATTTQCRIYSSAPCDVIEDEGGCG